MGPSLPNLKRKNWVAVLQRAEQRRVLKLQAACWPGQPPQSRLPAKATATSQAERPQDQRTEPHSTRAWDLSLGAHGVQLLPGRQWLQEECRTWTKLSLNWGRSLKSVARDTKSLLLEESVFESLGSCCCYSVSCVRLSVIPRTAARQASLSFTVFWRLLRFMSIESVMLIISSSAAPFPFRPQSFLASGSFPMSRLQPQQQSFQWIFRVEILKVKKKKELSS